ncbi:MAG: carbohydrate kinase family protein [Candidatus Bathyarchaeota archaeon]|nr:carbohydrate kinase family protein [Candidatus Bathyarchaeota archaeon]
MNAQLKKLADFLQNPQKTPKVTVLPDFFLDRIVTLDCNVGEFAAVIEGIAQRKGGSIDQISQTDLYGGNAINVAAALVALEANVTPIVCTNHRGLEQIRRHLQAYDIDTSHIKTKDKASITTALEFAGEEDKANVMLRDVGSLEDFGPGDLTEADHQLIRNSDYVCLFNWAGTRKHGTALAQNVFKTAKNSGCKTYYATADPTANKVQMPQLLEQVLKTDLADILSLNENEALCYGAMLSPDIATRQGKEKLDILALEAARVLAEQLSARIDLHTTRFAATVYPDREVVVPAFEVTPQRATGAGDAWDAGNIIGDYNGVSDQMRLLLANAVSACYLLSPKGVHPSREKVLEFLETAKPREL